MSFSVEYDFPARAAFARVPCPASADVDGAVMLFAAERAPHLADGAYRIRAAGYRLAVRVRRDAALVLVLWGERVAPASR